MKKKKIVQIVTLALAVTTIATTAFATSMKREGYDMFKNSFKSMKTMDTVKNATMNINLDVEDNGVNIASIEGKVKADHEEQKMSGAFTVGVENITKEIEVYGNDQEKIIVDVANDKYYKINESNHYRVEGMDHRGMKNEEMGEMTAQQEALLDYFIGDYKDKFELMTDKNGNKVISFNLKEDEIPVPVNLMISAVSSVDHENKVDMEVRDIEFEGLPLFEEINQVKDMPKLKEDIKVKELGFNITLNEGNQTIGTSFSMKVEGKDEVGVNHDMVVKGSVKIDGIDKTEVDNIDLSDKEVTVIDSQTNK